MSGIAGTSFFGPSFIGFAPAHLLVGAGLEGGIAHLERLGDALLDELVERHAGGDLHDPPQHVRRHRIFPGRAGLVEQCELAELVDHLGIGLAAVGNLHVEIGLLHRIGPHGAICEPRRMAHQVVHRHRPVLRLQHRLDRAVLLLLLDGDFGVGEGRYVHRHAVGQRELALFHQHHGRQGNDGFGHRGDAEDRVVRHRDLRFLVAEAVGLEHHDLAVARDQHDGAGQLVVLHALVQPVA
jgi:hypothetical protein